MTKTISRTLIAALTACASAGAVQAATVGYDLAVTTQYLDGASACACGQCCNQGARNGFCHDSLEAK